jgi:transcriptional regulator with XRE-family HTH domain
VVNSGQEDRLLSALGLRVKERREALGLSRQEAAERAGINFDYLGSIERGERNVATINLARLARALDYEDVGQLMDGLSLPS